MAEKNKTERRVDVEFSFGEPFLDMDTLDRFQRLLMDYAPKWTAGLHIWRYRELKTPMDLTHKSALRDGVISKGLEHGPYYEALVKRFGPPKYDRQRGICELRGASKALILVIEFDQYVLKRNGEIRNWGNTIAMQFLTSQFEGQATKEWIDVFFARACEELAPWHAHASTSSEWAANNLAFNTPDGARVRAVGIDKTKYLPGLYWQNYFGGPYVDFIGRQRLLSAPACRVQEIGGGVLVKVFEDPYSWASPESSDLKRRVLAHLGEEFFFIKEAGPRTTRAPDFSFLGDKLAI
jgi:hypothetical protein